MPRFFYFTRKRIYLWTVLLYFARGEKAMSAEYIFSYGPEGRTIKVNDKGQLLVNADAQASGFVFCWGETGYPLAVDGTGRLLVNVSGLSGVGGGVTDHGLLTGLTDDDHPQYILVDGTRGFTGTISGVIPQHIYDLATKGYVDAQVSGVDLSLYYRKDEDLIPSGLYDIGSLDHRFAVIYAQSGNFLYGIQVGSGTLHISPDGELAVNLSTVDIDTYGEMPVVSGGQLPESPGDWLCYSCVYNGKVFVGSRDSDNVYSITPSGWQLECSPGSGTKIGGLTVWRGKLAIASISPWNYTWVFLYDGNNLEYIGQPSGTGGAWGATSLAEYNGDLICSVVGGASAGSKQPIFKYDGNSWGILCRVHAQGGTWGWNFGCTSLGNTLYVWGPNEDYVSWYDGVKEGYFYAIGHHCTYGIVYKGRAYGCGNGLWLIDQKERAVKIISDCAGQQPCIYQGKLIYTFNGNEVWAFDGRSTKLICTLPSGKSIVTLAPYKDRLCIICGDGSYFWYRGQLSAIGEDDTATASIARKLDYIKNIHTFIGSDDDSSPTYTSNNYVQTGDNLASGISKLDAKIAEVELDINAIDSNTYKKDENLIPAASLTYNIGSSGAKFNDLYVDNIYAQELDLGLENKSSADALIYVDSSVEQAASFIRRSAGCVVNVSGVDIDLCGTNNNWYITSDGVFYGVSGVFGGQATKYTEVVTSWTPSGSLYYADVHHNFGDRLVVVQCYDPTTYNSVGIDHHVLLDKNTVRVFASSSGALGVIVVR